jgi:hypothetical protein
MKYPDFIKTTGRVCPKHRCPTYYDESGKERCGACDLYHANKNYNDSIPQSSTTITGKKKSRKANIVVR